MQDVAQAIDPSTIALIEQTVRASMAPFGLKAVHVRPGEDHDGDPVILIEAQYDLTERPIEPDVLVKLGLALRDELWRHGETRFPHIEHKFDERHKVSRLRKARA
jgi:hypothetical protein